MNIKLAHFELLEEIGHGGLGVVFRAFDPSLNRHVAIKVLKDEFAQDPKFVEDFLRESRNAAAISHPHIAQVHFVGEYEENRYMVMELVNGRSLEQIVQEDGPMPEAKALQVAIEISEALKAGYAVNQMIHGDIKPQNIVVGEECGAKLLDFGLAQLANVEANDSSDGVWGSPYYISPERVGRKAEDFRSDIYSLGATIFEALTGRPPFDAEDSTELALKRLNEKPPLLRTLNPNISKRTEQIINKMLHKNLLMRYLDYDTLLNDLRKAKAAALGHAPMTDTMEMRRTTGYITSPIPAAPPRSQLPVILAASLLSCFLVGGFFYFLLSKKSGSQTAGNPTPTQAAVAEATPLSMKNGSRNVKFHYHDPSAKQVFLVGNLTVWKPEPLSQEPGNPGEWSIDKIVPLDVAIEYQFVVDGKSIADPLRPRLSFPDGKGSFKTIWNVAKSQSPKSPDTPKTAQEKPASTPARSSGSSLPASQAFQKGVEACNLYLKNYKLPNASKEIDLLVPSTPEEERQKTLLATRLAGIGGFRKIMESDINGSPCPLPVELRNGKRYSGGIRKAGAEGFSLSSSSGEIVLPTSDLSPETLLAISDYYLKKETNAELRARRTWLAGVAALCMGLDAQGKALLEEAARQKGSYKNRNQDVLAP